MIAFAVALAAIAVAVGAPRAGFPEVAPGAYAVAVIMIAWLAWTLWRHQDIDD